MVAIPLIYNRESFFSIPLKKDYQQIQSQNSFLIPFLMLYRLKSHPFYFSPIVLQPNLRDDLRRYIHGYVLLQQSQ